MPADVVRARATRFPGPAGQPLLLSSLRSPAPRRRCLAAGNSRRCRYKHSQCTVLLERGVGNRDVRRAMPRVTRYIGFNGCISRLTSHTLCSAGDQNLGRTMSENMSDMATNLDSHTHHPHALSHPFFPIHTLPHTPSHHLRHLAPTSHRTHLPPRPHTPFPHSHTMQFSSSSSSKVSVAAAAATLALVATTASAQQSGGCGVYSE